jgi:putative ABC transport system permease protein
MTGRVRTAFATVSSPPWRRAPWLLWRHPGVLAMVAGATLVLVAPLAAVPLFLSSVGTASVAVQADERCPRDTGASYTVGMSPLAAADPAGDPLRPLIGAVGPTTRWSETGVVHLSGADPVDSTAAVVLARDGATDHIDVVAGTPGAPGAWLTDRAAADTGLGPGDVATIDGAAVPVVGVYRDLAGPTVDDNWCAHADLLLVRAEGTDRTLPPPVLLVDRPTFAALAETLDAGEVGVTWEAPLRPGLTVTDTAALVDDLACDSPAAPRLDWCAAGPPAPADRDREVAGRFRTHLPFVLDRSGSIRTSVAGGVWPVAGLAALAGLGFVAAAGSLWVERRRREVTLLSVRGVSPAGLGLKAVLELVLPLLAGAAGGVALAYGLVRWLGPSPIVERSAVAQALVSGAAGLAAAVLVVGAVVARRVSAGPAGGARATWLRVVPWELALVALAVLSYRRLGEWGVPISHGAGVTRVDPLGLLFPVLFILAAVAVAARVLVLALVPLRAASRGWSIPWYLAVRRVSRYRVAVVGLVAASAVAAGVLGYAATLNRSLEATLDTKARAFVGSDVAVRLRTGEALPAGLAAGATDVASYTRSAVEVGDGEREVTVRAIDPATFEQATFWDPSFSGTRFGEILDRLAAPAGDGPVPAVVVGLDGLPDRAGAVIRGPHPGRFTIEQVAHVRGFPGMRRPSPTVYVAADNLDRLDLGGTAQETWIRGDRDEILATLRGAGTAYMEIRRPGDVIDRPAFLTVAWTFDFMQAIAIAAGLLVLGGLAAYLDARRRHRLLGYAFARRMGLTAGQHRLALLAELAASVVAGCWLGLGIALVGAWLAYGRVDPVPTFKPGPVLRPAIVVVMALAALATVVAVAAAALAQRRADRDSPVEVLRAGA